MNDDGLLRKIEVDDIAFFKDNQYEKSHTELVSIHDAMVDDGRLEGAYDSAKWMVFSGVKHFGIDFSMDRVAYEAHIGAEFGISYEKMQDMLRCYALYICGIYIFPTISAKITTIKVFLTGFGDRSFSISIDNFETIADFLCFIDTPDDIIDNIMLQIRLDKSKRSNPRTLSHLINYLAVANEVNDLYHSLISADDFKTWFPILFWVNVTFVIPLRATEMLLTPYNCVEERNGKYYLRLRRTTLKSGKRTVYYDVNKDYKEFVYEVPNTWIVEMIQKYQELTCNHPRNYLFDHTKYMINNMVSLQSFNALLAAFVQKYLIGNEKYDYSRYATGIEEFSLITAGDSRPIAMANLYFQDVSVDTCRQLADHSRISTSYNYYTNVSNTIQCASIMKIQRHINRDLENMYAAERSYAVTATSVRRDGSASACLSSHQPKTTGDITDCLKENHLQECFGCRYYFPSQDEIKQEFEERNARLDEISRQIADYMYSPDESEKKGADINKLFLTAQTDGVRFRTASDLQAKEVAIKWQRHKSTETNCF